MNIEWWNKNKMGVAPFAALILWLISIVCFVFGLSFKNQLLILGYDLGIVIAFALSLCNTFIQLIGNDMVKEDVIFLWIWRASYLLGISSNTNTLLQIIGIDSVALEWGVALALGAIIEVAPERLVVLWLRSLKDNKKPNQPQNQQHQNKHIQYQPTKSNYKPQHKPQPVQQRREPTYHPIPAFPPIIKNPNGNPNWMEQES